jgi:4-amino-4-deoxy-L-arabinose transferase-like glycosyltransferase
MRTGWVPIVACSVALWLLHGVWLAIDTRPPVWDMAVHQTYALNYLPGFSPHSGNFWELSGNYPPLVHLFIAGVFWILHPDPRIAPLVNFPATFLLFWSLFELGRYFVSAAAAKWACILMLLTPYLIWLSRETILDYWLSAWVAAAWVCLIRTNGFESRTWARLFGVVSACGLLTKWLFAGFMAFPFLYVALRHRIWKDGKRLISAAESLILASAIASVWYLPNLSRLARYFTENAQIGVLEGEPPVFSYQSFIYYLRLLEGYQLFALLFLLLALGLIFVLSKQVLREPLMWCVIVAGGWLSVTLLRTKDPRFTMPLLAPLLIIPGAWLASWTGSHLGRVMRIVVIALLVVQAYAINFGISWLPEQVILMRGYQGSLRWDWQLYSQDYFGISGAPRREDWKQVEILNRAAEEARRRSASISLALVPDLPRFDSSNFLLAARLAKLPARVVHLQAPGGLDAFEGYDFAVVSEREQGISWTTNRAAALNQFILDRPDIFNLVSTHTLPTGTPVRLYFINNGVAK